MYMPSLRLIGKQIKNQKSEYLQKWAYDSNYQKKKWSRYLLGNRSWKFECIIRIILRLQTLQRGIMSPVVK